MAVVIGLIAAAAAGGIAFVLIDGRSTKAPAAQGTVAVTSSPTSRVSLTAARALVVKYLDDVNAQNRTAAKSLICDALVNDWQSTIDQPGGDFTVSVTRATFQTSQATATGVELEYTLEVQSVGTNELSVNTVAFTVVDSAGTLQICGES